MNSGYLHTERGLNDWWKYLSPSTNIQAMVEDGIEKTTITADEVVGNKLRLEEDITVFIGFPASNRTERWQKGFLSPEVYSWVQSGSDLYWMIGELPPFRYVKHDPAALEVEAYYGGGEYLNENDNSGSIIDLSGPGLGKLDDILKKGMIVAGVGFGIYFLTPFAPTIRDGFENLAEKFKSDTESNG